MEQDGEETGLVGEQGLRRAQAGGAQASLVADGKESACNAGEDPLEKGMTTHSSILAWRIPWTEKPGGLQASGSQSRTRLSD